MPKRLHVFFILPLELHKVNLLFLGRNDYRVYDSTLLFPFRYAHDLPLVTEPDLPQMFVPLDTPRPTEWFAMPQDALNADACFVTYIHTCLVIQYSTKKCLQKHLFSERPRQALIQGVGIYES
jgi:hypothetical protein